MRATAKEMQGLPPVNAWGRVRRAFGIFTKDEKEVLAYARKVQALAMDIVHHRKVITARPEWLRIEDYHSLQRLQKRVTTKRVKR